MCKGKSKTTASNKGNEQNKTSINLIREKPQVNTHMQHDKC